MCCGSGSSPRAGCTARRAPPSPPAARASMSPRCCKISASVRRDGLCRGRRREIICRKLEARGIETDFIRIPGQSRVNVKIKGKEETEINASGPDIPREALKRSPKNFRACRRLRPRAGGQRARLPPEGHLRAPARRARAPRPAGGGGRLGRAAAGRAPVPPLADQAQPRRAGRDFRPAYAQRGRGALLCGEAAHDGRAQRHRQHGRGRRDDGHRLRLLLPVRLCGGSRGHRRRGRLDGRGLHRGQAVGKDDREALRFAVAAGCATAFRSGLAEPADSAPSSPAAERI